MMYYLDHNGYSAIFPEELRWICNVRYVTCSIDHSEMNDLCLYVAWSGWLRREFIHVQFLPTPAFREWMYSPYTSGEFNFSDIDPQIPRIVLAAAAMCAESGGLKLLHNRAGREALLLWFFFQFAAFFPDEKWPEKLLYLFQSTVDEPLAIIPKAYRTANEGLRTDFPCRTKEEQASYVHWTLSHMNDLYPEGLSSAEVAGWLQDSHPADTGEGLNWILAGIYAQTYMQQGLSLQTSFERLRFVSLALLNHPKLQISAWQWRELSVPYGDNPSFPKFAGGIAASWYKMKEDELAQQGCRRKVLGLYLRHALPLAGQFGFPEWLRQSLLVPASDFPDAEKFGISELMACLGLGILAGPGLTPGGERSFIRWYLENEYGLPEELFAAHWQLSAWKDVFYDHENPLPQFGRNFLSSRSGDTVTVQGWAEARSGVGEDYRTMHAAVKKTALLSSCIDIEPLVPFQDRRHVQPPTGPVGLVNIVCLAAQDIYRLLMNTPAGWWAGRYTIGFCPWELPEWPKSARYSIERLDAIWAPSAFVGKAFAATGKPVTVMPNAVYPLEPCGDLRDELGIPIDTTVFLASYDSNASYTRKNPIAVIRAFNRAFAGSNANVQLIVKTMNAKNHQIAWRELFAENQCGNRIRFIDDWLSPQQHALLMNTCDAFVSLHRSEGFGRLLAEAMTLGKLLIASDFGGNTDYATPETACMVGGSLIDLEPGLYLFGDGQQWFDPDVDHAAAYMRSFAANPERFSALMHKGKQKIWRDHSLEALAGCIEKVLHDAGITPIREEIN